jgi:gliding motility-associated-like protein
MLCGMQLKVRFTQLYIDNRNSMTVKQTLLPRVVGFLALLSAYSVIQAQTTIISDGSWKGVGSGIAAGGTAWLFPGYNDAAWPAVEAPNAGNVIPVVAGSQSIWVLPYSDTAKMRKTFIVPVGDSYNGSISINADNEFTLYFNGVSQGFYNNWMGGPYVFNISPVLVGCNENVIAVDGANWGGPYGASLSTTINVTNPLNTPVATAATGISCDAFTANWNAVPTADFYMLDVSTDPNFGTFYSVFQDFNVGNVLSYNLTSIPGPGPYYYRLRCQRTNGLGTLQSCYSNVITVNLASPPTVNAGNDVYLCPGSSTTLNATASAGTIAWTPAVGIAPTNTLNPTVNPAATTTYTLTVTSGTCVTTDMVNVNITNLPPLVLSNDTTICPGSTVNLNVVGGDYVVWSPFPGMIDSSLTTQTVTPAVSTTYTVTSYTVGPNLIVNGNFSAGNTGFSSSYNYSFPNTTEGEYYVGTNPSAWNGGLSACTDHTSGAGNMLLVNGSPIANVSIWCQTIPVSPNTDYLFSTWVTPAYPVNPPILQFSINGGNIGSLFSPSGGVCTWEEFFATWNSGVATSANICIVNQNINVAGNDFALDDISFSPVCTQTGTVDVTIAPIPVPNATNTGPYCTGGTINLSVGAGFTDWDWTGPLGYNQPNTQNPNIPVATVSMSGNYTVTVTNAAGCSATSSTNVVVNNSLPIVPNNTGPYCAGATINLTAPAGATTYDWAGPLGYSQLNTQNPNIVSSTVAMAGNYSVTATYPGGCTATGSTTVTVNSLPTPAANSNSPICDGANLNLTSNGGIDYDWTGPNVYVQNDTQNPSITTATTLATGIYTVTVSDANGCSATASTNVTVNALPAVVAANTGPVCNGANVDFNSNGAVNYSWTGPGGFTDPNQNSTLVAAVVAQSGTYTVTGTDANGCSNTATTNMLVNPLPVINANINTPVCEGQNFTVSALGATTYNWTGPNAFSAINAANATIVNSTPVNAGVYTVTGTDGNNCSSTATITAVVNPMPVPAFSANITSGCTPLCVNFTDNSNITGSTITGWSWNIESAPGTATTNTSNCFNNAGLYDASLTVTSAEGCSATSAIVNYINVTAQPVAEFMYSPQLITIEEPEVNFGNASVAATNYAWDLGDGTLANSANVTHTYADTGTYCVTLLASNNIGCADTVTHCLIVLPIYTIYIPNSFTPNNDGLNEQFMAYGIGVKTFEAIIFNRWGQEVFRFSDIHKGWPGSNQSGVICQVDTYVYKISVVDFQNKNHDYSGMVNLIR